MVVFVCPFIAPWAVEQFQTNWDQLRTKFWMTLIWTSLAMPSKRDFYLELCWEWFGGNNYLIFVLFWFGLCIDGSICHPSKEPQASSLAFTKEDYRDDHQVMRDLLDLIVVSLDEASRAGVPLASGGKLHPICLGNKGDWPYLASSPDYITFYLLCEFLFWQDFPI